MKNLHNINIYTDLQKALLYVVQKNSNQFVVSITDETLYWGRRTDLRNIRQWRPSPYRKSVSMEDWIYAGKPDPKPFVNPLDIKPAENVLY